LRGAARARDPTLTIVVVGVIVFVTMVAEAWRAARNERAQRRRGGQEPVGDVYKMMRVAYPAAFAAMCLESLVRGPASRTVFAAGAAVFGIAKLLKWWAIASLGPAWTFRIIIVPGAPLVDRGPYRFLRHPNYVGVVGELVGTALMTGATVSGPVAVVLFGMLLRKRIAVEDRALASAARYPPCSL